MIGPTGRRGLAGRGGIMSVAEQYGQSISELVASVPMVSRPRRDPYAGFEYTRTTTPGVIDDAGLGIGWRSALQAQSRGRGGPFFGNDGPDAYGRMFETEIGRTAAEISGNGDQSLWTIGNLAAETLAAAMTLETRFLRPQRRFWEEDDVRTLVVPGIPRIGEAPTVLLLDPRADAVAKRVTDQVVLMPGSLEQAELRLRGQGDGRRGASRVEDMMFRTGPDALLAALWITRPEVIVARMPKMIPLQCPSPALEVRSTAGSSSVGMFCRDAAGTAGFTACYHGTGPAGTAIELGGLPTEIRHASAVQDIVFAALPDGYVLPPDTHGLTGIRRNRAPAQNDPATFDGCTSGRRNIFVTSHDAGLLRQRATVQLKVQTTADLDRGDSGSALIDDEDRVMAFAFERTGIDEPIQFADWIWAANAFDALGLQTL
ncbi:hypothetical protein [Sphingopyxis fribergensis]